MDSTVIVKCWEPKSHTARVLWYEATKTIKIPIQELFHRNVATRVDAKGQLSHSRRCHFEQDRTLPRPQLGTTDEAHMPLWLSKGVQFCKAQPADYIPRIFTDGAYDKADHDLHYVFDDTAVRRHAAASVVIVHDGPDWKDRLVFSI